MRYVKQDGTNNTVLILLHAMGGDATSLFDIADTIDPDATKLGIEGNVFEEGERRYFERFIDWSFVPDSLAENTRAVYELICKLIKAFNWEDRTIIVVGLANGANVAQNILKEYAVDFDGMVIFHPSLTRPFVPYKQQDGLRALVTFGIADPHILREEYEWILDGLKAAGVDAIRLEHTWGHVLKPEEVEAARDLVKLIADEQRAMRAE